jgi:hypothetical protein
LRSTGAPASVVSVTPLAVEDADLALLHEQHVARVRQQRGDVARAEGLALADADDERGRVLRDHDAVGLVLAEHRDGVRAP